MKEKLRLLNEKIGFNIQFPFLLLLLSFYLLFGFTSYAYYEKIAGFSSWLSAYATTTKSLNLNINCTKESVLRSEIEETASTCYSLDINKTSTDNYDFRCMYSSANDTYFSFDDYGYFEVSALVHSTAGTHLNANKENIFNWFEVKTLLAGNVSINYSQITSFVEVRESFAKKIIEKQGYAYSREICSKLVTNGLYFSGIFYNKGTSQDVTLQVNNVVLEGEGKDEKYVNTFGNYLLFYPLGLDHFENYCINFDFGTSFPETTTYLKYIKKRFPAKSYNLKINQYNIIDITAVDTKNRIDMFNQSISLIDNQKYIDISIVWTTAVFAFLIFSFYFYVFIKKRKKTKHLPSMLLIVFFGIDFAVSYLVMFIVSKVSYASFSQFFSISAIFSSFLSVILLCILFFVLMKKNNLNQNRGIEFCHSDFKINI